MLLSSSESCTTQEKEQLTNSIPDLPEPQGMAGMIAGVSHGKLICMGGANFPDKLPWQGGKKKWHDAIYIYDPSIGNWEYMADTMASPMAYAVSTTYNNKVWIAGGNNAEGHLADFYSVEWVEGEMEWTTFPSLPYSLANMAGTRVGSLFILVGGMEKEDSNPSNQCYGIDLDFPERGWFLLPSWPGPERIFPVCGSYNGKLYMFSGENSKENSKGKKQRNILMDAYCFEPRKQGNQWTGEWTRLGDIPRGMSAGPSPAPLIQGNKFRLWGGVDQVTALYTDSSTHPGIHSTVLFYDPENDQWEYDVANSTLNGRVTLPTVEFQNNTYYISGEIGPGVRDNSILIVE